MSEWKQVIPSDLDKHAAIFQEGINALNRMRGTPDSAHLFFRYDAEYFSIMLGTINGQPGDEDDPETGWDLTTLVQTPIGKPDTFAAVLSGIAGGIAFMNA